MAAELAVGCVLRVYFKSIASTDCPGVCISLPQNTFKLLVKTPSLPTQKPYAPLQFSLLRVDNIDLHYNQNNSIRDG
jgi:hypothetical protein